jgi:hypothetical protein
MHLLTWLYTDKTNLSNDQLSIIMAPLRLMFIFVNNLARDLLKKNAALHAGYPQYNDSQNTQNCTVQ